jgi:hypothetical protein
VLVLLCMYEYMAECFVCLFEGQASNTSLMLSIGGHEVGVNTRLLYKILAMAAGQQTVNLGAVSMTYCGEAVGHRDVKIVIT